MTLRSVSSRCLLMCADCCKVSNLAISCLTVALRSKHVGAGIMMMMMMMGLRIAVFAFVYRPLLVGVRPSVRLSACLSGTHTVL
jgi:hypothetical protein